MIDLSPYWKVLSPWEDKESPQEAAGPPILRIIPDRAFGDGAHPTTQLCLRAFGYLLRTGIKPATVLDFGAGSGILGIAAARNGARIDAVEIDEQAHEDAAENAELNGCRPQLAFHTSLPDSGHQYEIVFANILHAVLADHASELCRRLHERGHMILSGLVATDVPSILAMYGALLPGHRSEVYEQGVWRAIVFSPQPGASP